MGLYSLISVTFKYFLHKPIQLEHPTVQLSILKQTDGHSHWVLAVLTYHRATDFSESMSPCLCALPKTDRGQDRALSSVHTAVYRTVDSSLTVLGGACLQAHDLSPLFLYSTPCLTES